MLNAEQYIIIGIVSLVGSFVGTWLRSYFAKKAENLATKQDVEEITRKVETIRSDVEKSKQVELAILGNRIAAIRDVWAKVVRARNLVLALRPTVSVTSIPDRLSEEGKKAIADWSTAYNEFSEMLDANAPFLEEELFSKLLDIRKAIFGEGLGYVMHKEENWPKYWEEANKNQESIRALVEECRKYIRDKLYARDF
jgi:hypothetical protein